MHVLITGGTGFFGKAILRQLKAGKLAEIQKAKITLLSRNPEAFIRGFSDLVESENITLVKGNILDFESLPIGEYTHIIHAATDSTHGLALSPKMRFDQIVDGTKNVLELAVRGKNPKFLLVSSGGVYGPQPLSIAEIPETYGGMPDPLNPENAYSIGKRMAEHLTALYHQQYGLESVIARCFSFVGEDLPLDAHFAVGNFLRDALRRKPITIKGDGSPVRSYMDQRDLADWIVSILLKGKSLRAYNVGSDEAIALRDLALSISNLFYPELEVIIKGKSDSGQSACRNRYVPNISRARSELGLCNSYSLKQSLQNAMEKLNSVV